MAILDSIVNLAKQHAGLSDAAAGGLVAAMLRFLSDPARGGFAGFIERFRSAGLGSLVDSWISRGGNSPISNEQVESALGSEGIMDVADASGLDRGTATSAIAGILPGLVDELTPDGTIPDDSSLLSRIGGFLSNWGGASGAVAGTVETAAAMGRGAADSAGDAARAARDSVGTTVGGVGDSFNADSGGGSLLKWLIPLVLLGLAIVLGFWFCGPGTPTTTNLNVNMSRPASNINANVTSSVIANTKVNTAGTTRTLSEVALPNGTTLQAFPGGIEDQLVKFIESSEYKNATEETLKNKWFNFDDLNFVFGKTDLTPESKRQLDNIVSILKAFPDVKIKIGGYTDKKGDDAANLKLSDSRAKAVQAALQKAGVGSQVPEAEGYGEQFATVDENASDEERQVDRKTAVRLIKGTGAPVSDAAGTEANKVAIPTANATTSKANR